MKCTQYTFTRISAFCFLLVSFSVFHSFPSCFIGFVFSCWFRVLVWLYALCSCHTCFTFLWRMLMYLIVSTTTHKWSLNTRCHDVCGSVLYSNTMRRSYHVARRNKIIKRRKQTYYMCVWDDTPQPRIQTNTNDRWNTMFVPLSRYIERDRESEQKKK